MLNLTCFCFTVTFRPYLSLWGYNNYCIYQRTKMQVFIRFRKRDFYFVFFLQATSMTTSILNNDIKILHYPLPSDCGAVNIKETYSWNIMKFQHICVLFFANFIVNRSTTTKCHWTNIVWIIHTLSFKKGFKFVCSQPFGLDN